VAAYARLLDFLAVIEFSSKTVFELSSHDPVELATESAEQTLIDPLPRRGHEL
jgi:hypothetical protein